MDPRSVTTHGNQPASASTFMFKIVIGGAAAVGKTTLLQRYLNGVFMPGSTMTIGVEPILVTGHPVADRAPARVPGQLTSLSADGGRIK